MKKPGDIIDREAEWAELAACFRSPRPELAIVIGRRRAGKSFLLTRFASAVEGIYFQATRRTEREQLATLTRVVGEHFGDAALRRVGALPWEDLFEYLVERAAGKPLMLVLDEFPYLADAAPALPSLVQHAWDHAFAGSGIKLVLSGSHISAMRRLTEADQPLFGRRTRQIQVRPFSYYDTASFAPAWPPADRMQMYGIFGGLPGQVSIVEPELSLAENVARHVLTPGARLYDEGAHVFDAFVPDAEVHYSILEAIAAGETRWNKISNRVGKNTASLKRPLDWLVDMDVVRREAPITQYPNPSPKTIRYRVTDPYLVFWYRVILDLRSRGFAELRSPEDLWTAEVQPRLDGHMGPVFEEACRSFVARGSHPALPFKPVQIGNWWTEDGQEEVDVVALGPAGEVLLGECKWGTVSSTDLDTLERRGALIAAELKRAGPITFALFSGRGSQDSALDRRISAGEALHLSAAELFA
jgi:AAA+ ATPase superfamily predicted ATPase